jgi:hypothetical protein
MSHKALSDDESDHDSGTNFGRSRYSIVKEVWRSDELCKWLRMIDLLGFGEKWEGRPVAQRGNNRRFRIHSDRSKDGVAVAGLPENCYDPSWLSSLKACERKLLKVKPPLDMTFSENERLCVFLYSLYSLRVLMFTQSPFRQVANYIPLAKGEARPSTNPTNPDLDGLDEWLLNMYGNVRDQ